jgi:hypothetical protein
MSRATLTALALVSLALVSASAACGGIVDDPESHSPTGSSSSPSAPSTPGSGSSGTAKPPTTRVDGPTRTPTPPPDFAWYLLDETSGTTAHDSSPHGYDITNLTGVSWGNGATFDGATVCGSTVVDPAFRVPPVTMTAWLTPAARDDESSATYALEPFPSNAFSGDVPSLGGYGIGLDVWTDDGGGAAVAVEHGIGVPAPGFESDAGPFVAGTEYFVASVADATSVAVYVDGSLFAQNPGNLPPSVAATPLHLGCHNDDPGYLTKRFFAGQMRDARIYKRALGPAEIAQLAANGPATTSP